jgi:hypothetical protein
MIIPYLMDFEGVVYRCDPSKVRLNVVVGKLVPVNQTVVSLLRTPSKTK